MISVETYIPPRKPAPRRGYSFARAGSLWIPSERRDCIGGGPCGSFAARGQAVTRGGGSPLLGPQGANLLAWWGGGGVGRTYSSTLYKTGTGTAPAVTISGGIPANQSFVVDIPTGGARGTATYRYSMKGDGTDWSSAAATAASVDLGNGIVLAFGTGTNYATDNVYTLKVSDLADRSGNSYTLSQGTGANMPRPRYSATGLPGLIYDGSTYTLSNAAVANAFVGGSDKAHSAFVVFKFEHTPGADEVIWSCGHATDQSIYDLYWDQGVTRWRTNKRGTTGGIVTVASTGVADTSRHLLAIIHHGTTADVYVDGAAVATAASQDVTSMTVDAFFVGSLYSTGTSSRYANVSINEMTLFNTDLGTTAKDAETSRLRAAYGV